MTKRLEHHQSCGCKYQDQAECTNALIDSTFCLNTPIQVCPYKSALVEAHSIELSDKCKCCVHNGFWLVGSCPYNDYSWKCSTKFQFIPKVKENVHRSFLFKFYCWKISAGHSFINAVCNCWFIAVFLGCFVLKFVIDYDFISISSRLFFATIISIFAAILVMLSLDIFSDMEYRSSLTYKEAEKYVEENNGRLKLKTQFLLAIILILYAWVLFS